MIEFAAFLHNISTKEYIDFSNVIIPEYIPSDKLTDEELILVLVVYSHWLIENHISSQDSNAETFKRFKMYLLRVFVYSSDFYKEYPSCYYSLFIDPIKRVNIYNALFGNNVKPFVQRLQNKKAIMGLTYQESILGQYLLGRSDFKDLKAIKVSDIAGYSLNSLTPLYLYNIDTKEDLVRVVNIFLQSRGFSRTNALKEGWDNQVFYIKKRLGMLHSMGYDFKSISKRMNISIENLKILTKHLFNSTPYMLNCSYRFLCDVNFEKMKIENEKDPIKDNKNQSENTFKDTMNRIWGTLEEDIEKVDIKGIQKDIESEYNKNNSIAFMWFLEYFKSKNILKISKEMLPKNLIVSNIISQGLFKPFKSINEFIICMEICLLHFKDVKFNNAFYMSLDKWLVKLPLMIDKGVKVEANKLDVPETVFRSFIKNI